jgi:putative DNA methylase
MTKKKLIEVALPLDAINAQSAREKSIRHGHPSTLHLWWARRPLATARAVLFAQLVDDPSSREDEFREEALRQNESDVIGYTKRRIDTERERLFDLITRMVDWDNLGDDRLFDAVRAEIDRSTGGNPPAILDPFAGGGTIPLEAQRLGLEAHASDLNPVAVLINRALIEIPPKFADCPPVFPDAAAERNGWSKAAGLAEDVRRYGAWMRDEAEKRIGHLYPKATGNDGTEATVIAWIWARTVTCPNPACGIEMPLVRSWWLGRKKGKEAYVVPTIVDGKVEYSIGHDPKKGPTSAADGTVGRNGATCVSCGAPVELSYVRSEGRAGKLGKQLMAVVAEGRRSRSYLAADFLHSNAANVDEPIDIPVGPIPNQAPSFRVQAYGMNRYTDLFTNRQLTALTTFSDLVGEGRDRVLRDALDSGLPEGDRLEQGGTEAAAYADAVATYLAQAISRVSNKLSSICSWDSSPKMESVRGLFARQAIPMAWDYAEANPFGGSGGDLLEDIAWVTRVIEKLPGGEKATVVSADAASRNYDSVLISTDPPYYDNIGYSDLSDFFYVWLRRSLKSVHPKLLSTMLVPKAEELVANPYRHGGKDGAREFFEHGFEDVFTRARESANLDYPITVYYAFKQSETDARGQASTGWETILSSMIRAGWSITATWPMRSELGNRMIASGTNALASSIVLALRPRSEDAPAIDRRGFSAELRSTLPEALRALQQGSVAPVDLAQAAIGPGMAVYSKYSEVIESDGSPMPVREALRQINAMLDEVVSEQEGDFDADTRWCISWFEGHGFTEGPYGDAETLANAKNASVDGLRRSGVLRSSGGRVVLLAPGDFSVDYDPMKDDRISLWEVVLHLVRALDDEQGGLDAAGRILYRAGQRGVDTAAAHQLAYLLYSISEKKGWTASGILFNGLGSSWPEVRAAARAAESNSAQGTTTTQLDFDSLGEN